MSTIFNTDQSTATRHRYRQISNLLINHLSNYFICLSLEIHHKGIFKQNANFKVLLNKKTKSTLLSLKNDQQAKQLTLKYFSSFELLQDILTSKIDANCLTEIQQLCNYFSN
ncbi:unnamed protein product [Paramecium octaurelia]|uniref:Uncharacterized protein n=1 Tax=Paramecium octaurelia TaxID=43137 RepID=A0A8S1WDA3_PAROT|nr:unnamed protein product [Paramecium octaurelia]